MAWSFWLFLWLTYSQLLFLNMTFKSFETERLILKPTDLEDVDLIFELMNSPKWLEYIGDRNIKTKEDARQYILDKQSSKF